jgi:glutathione S-transferase
VYRLSRLTLLYKRVPFEIVRVPFADVQRVSKEVGIPQPAGVGKHTLPAISDPATGTRLADSLQIAHYLDERFPERPLFPSGTEERQVAFVNSLMGVIGMVRARPLFGSFVLCGSWQACAQDALIMGLDGMYKVLDKASQALYDERLPSMDVDLGTIEHM